MVNKEQLKEFITRLQLGMTTIRFAMVEGDSVSFKAGEDQLVRLQNEMLSLLLEMD